MRGCVGVKYPEKKPYITPECPPNPAVSARRVLVLGRCRCWGDWDVDMDVLLEDIMTPPAIVDNMLVFRVREVSRMRTARSPHACSR